MTNPHHRETNLCGHDGLINHTAPSDEYMVWPVYDMIILCRSALSDGKEIAVTRVGDGHDTRARRSEGYVRQRAGETYPTRNSFPAAVPSATFVPAKWWTDVLESIA